MIDKYAFKLCGWIAADSHEQAWELLQQRFEDTSITILAVSQLPASTPESIIAINQPPSELEESDGH